MEFLRLFLRRHFAGKPVVASRNVGCFVRLKTKWPLRNDCRNSILMTCHYPDLGRASDWLKQISHTAQPIRSTTQIWVVTQHQYGISALVSQTSFCRKTSGGVSKCWLFCQAKNWPETWFTQFANPNHQTSEPFGVLQKYPCHVNAA